MVKYLKNKYRGQNTEKKIDYILAVSLATIVILGLFFLSSASTIYSFHKFDGNAYHMVFRQILRGLLPGMILFFVFYKIDYHIFAKYYYLFYVLAVVLLLLVFIPGIGVSYEKALRWVGFPGTEIRFQPSEIVKLLLIIFLAGWFNSKGYANIRKLFYGFLPFIFYLGTILFLISEQPDYGTLAVLAFTGIAVYFVAGAKITHLSSLVAAMACLAILAVLRNEYLQKRILVFLNPGQDLQGIGYHFNQLLLTIGSGGFFGRGLGKSQQKFAYLPEVSGDSIFAVAAEELGFLIGFVIVSIFLVIVFRSLKIAQEAPDPLGRMIAAGIVSWIAFQAFFNIAVMVGVLPLTGVPLPFVSYGGTTLAISLAAMGMIFNISKQSKNVQTS